MLPAPVEKMLSRLLGKKTKTSANIAAGITTQEHAIAACHERIAAAQVARKAAIEDLDAIGHRKADDDIAEAQREIERLEHSIELLTVAHADKLQVEAVETFISEEAEMVAESAALAKRIKAEYPTLTGGLANLMTAIEQFAEKRKRHIARVAALSQFSQCENPEDVRGVSSKRWTVRWPNPEGNGTMSGSVEDAPRGSIAWIKGEPQSIRSDVRVEFRGGGHRPITLVETLGDLPPLYPGEEPVWRAREDHSPQVPR